ncbi:MAG: alcohol dehydrogenase catalytic domain-containing protein [Rhodothermales bacterium]|nr:alcohol dehydrogenase catalytic domain-containing protein [Rhodothermales bacterium]
MKALHYSDWKKIGLVDVTEPQAASGEVLVRVAACGICGSELESFRSESPRRTPPLIMGHEFCGHVVEGGSESGFTSGAKVIANAVVGCGTCSDCESGNDYLCTRRRVFGMNMDGAFAEYVRVPERAILHWPSSLSATEASLAEPAGNAVHVFRAINEFDHKRVLVLGAGPIGLFCQQVCQALGGSDVVVTDPQSGRRDVASRLGARLAVNPMETDLVRACQDVWSGNGPDVVIDAVGTAATKQQSLAIASVGGAIVWIGLHSDQVAISSYLITLKELRVVGTYGASADDMKQALDLMVSGDIDASTWVATVDFENSANAFMELVDGTHAATKVVINPGSD